MAEPLKKWIEVRAKGPVAALDEAAALLVGAGSQGVIEEVPFEPLPFDIVGPVVGDMTKRGESLTLIGYISAEKNFKKYNKCEEPFLGLEKALSLLGWSLRSSFFKDQAWTEKWKRFLRPVRAGGFLVRPVWSRAAPKRGEHLIVIEPAMAFGTGGHETTRLCLRAVKAAARGMAASSSMLDIGTGSGVLAIAGARLGFSRIVGTDIDEVALKNARKNLRINKVKARLTGKPLSELTGSFDLVVANIRTKTLYGLKEDIAGKVKPGGILILSGVLAQEATELVAGFEACAPGPGGAAALEAIKTVKCKEWVVITLRRGQAAARRR